VVTQQSTPNAADGLPPDFEFLQDLRKRAVTVAGDLGLEGVKAATAKSCYFPVIT
jgi:hypothetical protein